MSERVVTVDELQRLVRDAGKDWNRAAGVAVRAASEAMLADVVNNRMMGQYLGIDTGKGRQSMTKRYRKTQDGHRAEIGSPLGYIRAHELGFQGSVNVRAHQRRVGAHLQRFRGRVTKKSITAVKKAGKLGGMAEVRAHKRLVNIRARHFMRDTVLQEAGRLPGLLTGGAPPIERRIIRAIRIMVSENRTPKPGELGV